MTEEGDVAQLLHDLFTGRWPADRNPYDLNRALGVRPWWPPLVAVWQAPDEPLPSWTDMPALWQQAWRLRESLHGDYLNQRVLPMRPRRE